MPYRSIYGKRVGVSGDQLLVNGRVVGGSMPSGVGKGKTWYVSSVINAGNGESVDGAAGTLQEVIDFLDASSANDNQGHTIVILPNHAETITGAGGLTFDVPGIRVIGLGVGLQRPTFLMDGGTTVTAVVSADDVYIENCLFLAGHAAVASCFDVDAKGFHLVNCEFRDNTTHECFLIGVLSGSTTDNVCDGLTVVGCTFHTATDRGYSAVKVVGDLDYCTVERCKLFQGAAGGSAGSAGLLLDGTVGDDFTALLVKDNLINVHLTATDAYPIGGAADQTDNTGLIVGNRVTSLQSVGTSAAAGQNLFTKGTGFFYQDNLFSGKRTAPGKRIPFPTSTDLSM